ncbi:hypothetical protein [Endozoicomonas sp. Mp262]|uniref:hypothetical protein n=1 Tax=Endozoicomonas sp. Mp262 TaxID=2919499 RepID=UPI0021DACEA4
MLFTLSTSFNLTMAGNFDQKDNKNAQVWVRNKDNPRHEEPYDFHKGFMNSMKASSLLKFEFYASERVLRPPLPKMTDMSYKPTSISMLSDDKIIMLVKGSKNKNTPHNLQVFFSYYCSEQEKWRDHNVVNLPGLDDVHNGKVMIEAISENSFAVLYGGEKSSYRVYVYKKEEEGKVAQDNETWGLPTQTHLYTDDKHLQCGIFMKCLTPTLLAVSTTHPENGDDFGLHK